MAEKYPAGKGTGNMPTKPKKKKKKKKKEEEIGNLPDKKFQINDSENDPKS